MDGQITAERVYVRIVALKRALWAETKELVSVLDRTIQNVLSVYSGSRLGHQVHRDIDLFGVSAAKCAEAHTLTWRRLYSIGFMIRFAERPLIWFRA
jgi:hypothetical protein